MKKLTQNSKVIFSLLLVASLLTFVERSEAIQKALRMEQGWTNQDRQTIYNLSEGSELMPLRWFLHLEKSNENKKIYYDLEKYGFIYDPESNLTANPYSLPVGLTTHIDTTTSGLYSEAQWVGINCTACHTGLIEINGKNLLIDGAPSLFRIQDFEKDIVSSVQATLLDQAKLRRFLNDTQTQPDREQIVIQKLKLFSAEFSGWVDRNHRYLDKNKKEIFAGPGRVDGLGGPTNDLTCHLSDRLSEPALADQFTDVRNCQNAHPAVSLPHLWGMTDLEFVQWDGGVHASLGRNYGQATGTYGKNWVEKNLLGFATMKSTASIDSLMKIEDIYKKLRSVEWKQLAAAGLVNELDTKQVARGQVLYQKNCIACHAVQPTFSKVNLYGNSYWQTPIYSAQEIGVDGTYSERNLARLSYVPQALQKEYKVLLRSEDYKAPNMVLASKLRGLNIFKMMTSSFLTSKYPEKNASIFDLLNPFNLPNPLSIPEFSSCRDLTNSQSKVGFKSRSLEGISFTAPYLHNGSVPTLDDLLKPAAQRPTNFLVGCRHYDLQKMGYDCAMNTTNTFNFDVRQEGNSNAGHEYGTTLTAEERIDLISFIKSIQNPSRPSRSSNCY